MHLVPGSGYNGVSRLHAVCPTECSYKTWTEDTEKVLEDAGKKIVVDGRSKPEWGVQPNQQLAFCCPLVSPNLDSMLPQTQKWTEAWRDGIRRNPLVLTLEVEKGSLCGDRAAVRKCLEFWEGGRSLQLEELCSQEGGADPLLLIFSLCPLISS